MRQHYTFPDNPWTTTPSNEHWKTFNKIEGYDFENLVFSVTVNVENGSGIIKVNGNESYMTRVPEGETAERIYS